MTGHRSADVAERAGEIEAAAGVKLPDMIAVELLPWRRAGGHGVPGGGVSRGPFRGGHECIDSPRAEIDAHPIAGPQPRKPSPGIRLGGSIEDRRARRSAALPTVAERRQLRDSAANEGFRREHVDHLAASGKTERATAADHEQRRLVDRKRRGIDAGVIVLRPVEDDRPTFKRLLGPRLRKKATAEIGADHARLEERRVEEIPREDEEAGPLAERSPHRADHATVGKRSRGDVLRHRPPAHRQRRAIEEAVPKQFGHHGRQSTGPMKILAEVSACRLEIDQKRQVVAVGFPVADLEFNPGMPGDGDDVRGAVGAPAEGRVDADAIEERGAGHDPRRPQILLHHSHDPFSRPVSRLAPLPVGPGDLRRARQGHAEGLGEAVHRQRCPHHVAVADARR